jgi:hypothetical protein
MAKRRNYTQELLAKRAKGQHIVVSLAPHEGVPVTYSPRSVGDPLPWDAGLVYRFSGRECHAVKAESVSQVTRDLVLSLVDTLFDGCFQMGQDAFRFDYTIAELVPILAALTSDGMLERHADCYVLTSRGEDRAKILAVA